MDMDSASRLIILVFSQLVFVSSYNLPRYFVPTQEQFVAQQSQAALLHHRNQPFFGWPSLPGLVVGGNAGATSSTSFGSGSGVATNANAASGFSFPGGGGVGGGIQQPPQFFGGSFGLGFGFGSSGWYYPMNYPFAQIPPNNQQQQSPMQQSQLQQQQSSASVSASSAASAGFQFKPIDPQPFNPSVPVVLKPSNTGWDTSYNVPCGTYKIKPFVIANLRLATSTTPFNTGRRRRRSPFRFEYENRGTEAEYFQQERGFPSYFPPSSGNPVSIPLPKQEEPKTCLWNFNSDGPCQLKFKCVWFQLPALFNCNENYMQVTDATPNLNSTFCGNRKPREVYSSSSGKLILTFRSHTSSLPAVFDCAVTCTLEASPNEQKPNRKIVVASSNYNFIQTKDFNFSTSTEQEPFISDIMGSTSKNNFGVTEKHRIRIGDCMWLESAGLCHDQRKYLPTVVKT